MAKLTYKDFKDQLFAMAKTKGFSDFELYYSAGSSFSVRVLNGEISEYKNTTTEGAGFRGTFNGKMGYAYTENLDTDILSSFLDNAAANADIIEDEELEKLYQGAKDSAYPEVNTYNQELNNTETATKIQWALDMEQYALGLDPRVKLADFCTVLSTETHIAIANSYGLNLSQKSNMGAAYLIARVEEGGCNKSSMESWVGRDFADFDYKKTAKRAVEKALGLLGASTIPSGKYPVILDQTTCKDILQVFMSVFYAAGGQKGFSLLNKSKIGESIAAPIITLRDDGVCDRALYSQAFDAEGVATKNKAIIENGVLKNLLYTTKSAEKDGVESTGNASKAGFGGTINTSITNLYITPGEKSYDELVQSMEKGVIITSLAGLHSGTNTISGDFSVAAEGYYVEAGKIVKPVEQITVAGNFYELLKNIEAVGNDLKFFSLGASIGAPSVLIKELSIAGL